MEMVLNKEIFKIRNLLEATYQKIREKKEIQFKKIREIQFKFDFNF